MYITLDYHGNLHLALYIYIFIYICQDGGAPGLLTLVHFYLFCLRLHSHLIKCEVFKNTSSLY